MPCTKLSRAGESVDVLLVCHLWVHVKGLSLCYCMGKLVLNLCSYMLIGSHLK